MNLADLRAELEEELTWRMDDLRFFRNQMAALGSDERNRYRKALVVMLYSHFEGFWRAAFGIYVTALNNEGICCGDATHAIMAATFNAPLTALTDPHKKCEFFRNSAPDDAKLHLAAKQIEFIGRVREAALAKVAIPEEVMDAESNLTPVVVRKNLFRLGFNHELFAAKEGVIHHLLERRNAIAHGAARQGIEEEKYEALEKTVIDLMSEILLVIFESLRDQKYLKHQQGAA